VIRILADASISLTESEAAEFNINIVPMHYTLGGMAYLDVYADQVEAFAKIKAGQGRMTTSQPSVETYKDMLKQVLDAGDEVLCLCISARLSGSYSSAELAAKELGNNGIKILDTKCSTATMRMLALKAKDLIASGKSLDEVYSGLQVCRDSLGYALSVDNIEPLKRGGRLGVIKQSASSMLNIKPILELKNGTLKSVGFARGKTAQLKELLAQVPDSAQSIIVEHIDSESQAKQLAALSVAKFPYINNIQITTMGAVLAVHVGIPAIGIAWQK